MLDLNKARILVIQHLRENADTGKEKHAFALTGLIALNMLINAGFHAATDENKVTMMEAGKNVTHVMAMSFASLLTDTDIIAVAQDLLDTSNAIVKKSLDESVPTVTL